MRHPQFGFYGGVTDDQVGVGLPALGIQLLAERPIFGRGVLLDVERYLAERGAPIDQTTNRMITVADLEATAAAQKVELKPGDVILLRTGWAGYFLGGGAQAREAIKANWACPGLIQSVDVVEWLWDHEIAAVAADNQGVEAVPQLPDSPFADPSGTPVPDRGITHSGLMHRPLLALLGMPLGELWALDELADDCRADGIYEFLICAKPLNLIGGVGSPANAMAVK
jgi:kynurenine formamidase